MNPRKSVQLPLALYLAIDVTAPAGQPSPQLASAIVNGMRQRRVLISATGPTATYSKSGRPPFQREHADQLVTILADTLTAIAG